MGDPLQPRLPPSGPGPGTLGRELLRGQPLRLGPVGRVAPLAPLLDRRSLRAPADDRQEPRRGRGGGPLRLPPGVAEHPGASEALSPLAPAQLPALLPDQLRLLHRHQPVVRTGAACAPPGGAPGETASAAALLARPV